MHFHFAYLNVNISNHCSKYYQNLATVKTVSQNKNLPLVEPKYGQTALNSKCIWAKIISAKIYIPDLQHTHFKWTIQKLNLIKRKKMFHWP